MKEVLINSTHIINWGAELFQKAGVSQDDSKVLIRSLVTTSLWGIDSHGIERIPHYLNRFETGSIKTNPDIQFNKTGSSTGQVDGGDGHGIIIMTRATGLAIDLAREAGVGIIGVKNSSHCGAIGLYTRKITESGMVGIAFTHSDALVVPFEGKKAFLGTNPISIAFPTEKPEEPMCVDMATSIIPWNYIMNSRREKRKVAIGLGVDIDGNDSEDPTDIVAVKPMSGHKGYALAFMIDMLCGPLNGMAFGPNITPMYQDLDKKRGLGSLVIAIDPDRFGGTDFVKMAGSAMINQVKEQGEHILFPGQPEYLKMKKRMEKGIPLSDALIIEYSKLSDKFDVPFFLESK